SQRNGLGRQLPPEAVVFPERPSAAYSLLLSITDPPARDPSQPASPPRSLPFANGGVAFGVSSCSSRPPTPLPCAPWPRFAAESTPGSARFSCWFVSAAEASFGPPGTWSPRGTFSFDRSAMHDLALE